LTTHYQPAREVGGDFYDFLYFPDGRLGLIIADVTDKGVPAALVMATTRSILRMVAERLISPGQVLEQTNELLHHDIPPKMFVTCLYAVLDPATGRLQYANPATISPTGALWFITAKSRNCWQPVCRLA
jgi:serine phosphatase RsbU (regulator of sigma subunit)